MPPARRFSHLGALTHVSPILRRDAPALLTASLAWAAGPQYTDPAKTDADFPYQGEYAGELKTDKGDVKIGMQVIALGGGKFHAVAYHGGLPGDGWDKGEKIEIDGELKESQIAFKCDLGTGVLKGDTVTVTSAEGKELGQLKKVKRKSPTLGAKPPEGAIVLFDGKNADEWQNGKTSKATCLVHGTHQQAEVRQLQAPPRVPHAVHARRHAARAAATAACICRAATKCRCSTLRPEGREQRVRRHLHAVASRASTCACRRCRGRPTTSTSRPPSSTDGKKDEERPRHGQHNGVVIHNDIELPGDATPPPPRNGSGPSLAPSTCRTTATRCAIATCGSWRSEKSLTAGQPLKGVHVCMNALGCLLGSSSDGQVFDT